MQNQDLIKQVKSTNKTLENYFNGFYECIDCENQQDQGYECEECKGDSLESQTFFDYLQESLDIEWVLYSDKTLKGARVLVCFGGPNVWIDTVNDTIDGHWWGDHYSESFNSSIGELLNEYLEDIFNC